MRDINSLTGLSFVVVSGDVTEYGSREQLRLAKAILDELTIPCHTLPGNHDTKWSESGATDFARLWQADRFVFEQGGFRFIGLHQGPLMKMGDGHWAPQDVRWLQETLKKLPDPKQPIIFITHYPIDDGIANWFVVLDLLKQYNTQVVLCGHGHANQRYLFEGVPGVMGRSNLRARAPVGGFNLVEIKDGTMTFSERTTGQETLPPWHSVALRKHDYAADTNRYPRPDFSVNSRYPNVKPRWTHNTGYTIASTPAIWKDLAIVGDASGAVYALSLKSGKVEWTFKAANAVYSTPDVSGDRCGSGLHGRQRLCPEGSDRQRGLAPSRPPGPSSPARASPTAGSTSAPAKADSAPWTWPPANSSGNSTAWPGSSRPSPWSMTAKSSSARGTSTSMRSTPRPANSPGNGKGTKPARCSRPPPAGPSPPTAKSSSSPPTAR